MPRASFQKLSQTGFDHRQGSVLTGLVISTG